MNALITPSAAPAPANVIGRKGGENAMGNPKLKEEHDFNEIKDLLDEVQRSLGSIRATLTGAEEGLVGEDKPDEVAVVEPRRWRLGVFLVDVFVQFLAKFLALRTLAWMDRRAATAAVSAVTAQAATTATVIVTATTTRTTIATITETAVVLMHEGL